MEKKKRKPPQIKDSFTQQNKNLNVKSANNHPDNHKHNIIIDKTRGEMICNKCVLIFSENMINIKFSETSAYTKRERNKKKKHMTLRLII